MVTKKIMRVGFDPLFEKEYLKLVEDASQNKQPNERPNPKQLLKSIDHALDVLKLNVFAGKKIQADQINKEAIEKFGTDQLWKFDLINFWRLIYTIRGDKAYISALILTKVPHKEYNKIYKGKK